MKHTFAAVLGEEWDHRAGVLVRKDIPWTDEEITALLQTLGHHPFLDALGLDLVQMLSLLQFSLVLTPQ